jgi:hypothetical protein
MKNSFATVATQIVNYNTNIVELLTKLDLVSSSNESTVPVSFSNSVGELTSFNVPSLGFLLNEIQRLNNNINTIYSIDTKGALIQQSDNKYKKIITVDLNVEPNSISELNGISTFVAKKNWFFDAMLNPMLSVEIDLTDKIDSSVRKVLTRRYIVDFATTTDGSFTTTGQSALNQFNDRFRNISNINIDDFTDWYSTTPGLINDDVDEQMFDLEPNEVLYDGIFSVLKVEEDTLNRKLWYHLNTLDYIRNSDAVVKQLNIGDELILNVSGSSTKYKILEVSTVSANVKIRVERTTGNEPIPVLQGALKIYTPVLTNNKVYVSIGFDERNVIFLKSMDADNHLLAKDWSLGTGYYSNDLNLSSTDTDNGKTMEVFYEEKVMDYGKALNDLVEKKIPTDLGVTPNTPVLLSDNFKVVQINKHLTESGNYKTLSKKHNAQKKFKSELAQLDQAIIDKTKILKTSKMSKSTLKTFNHNLKQLTNKKSSKSKLLKSTVDEIISLSSSSVVSKVRPKYKVRGFWDMPDAVISRGSKYQEVVQFKVEYRYLSLEGKENSVQTFEVKKVDNTLSVNAAYSNWNVLLTDSRKRVLDDNGDSIWEVQDVADADTPNINQLEVSIQPNEKVEIRIKSLSEVGYPDSPLESVWSDILTVDFPDNLRDVLGDTDFILKEASQEEMKVRIDSELEAKGLDTHLSEMVVIGDKTLLHTDDSILTHVKDSTNGLQLSLFDYITQLEERLKTLEEQINKTQGILTVSVIRDSTEYPIINNEEIVFNVECEDYLDEYIGGSGRQYNNDIYVIKDFVLKVENTASSSELGLLSNRSYFTDSDFVRTDVAQTFWVNERDELLSNTGTGNTRTQLDNQFIWVSNYTSVDQVSATKLADNIGNDFISLSSNSITDVLSSTEYNVGYLESTILNFSNNNISLLESQKWVDSNISVTSNNKLLTSVHPVIQNLEDLVEVNQTKTKSINIGESNAVQIPLNIYFKMNSLNKNSGVGINYDYIDLNNATTSTRHIKKIRFFMENEADNKPFVFTIKFNINRNKIAIQKITPNLKMVRSSVVK